MSLKISIVFLISVTIIAIVESRPSEKLDVKNAELSELNSKAARQDNREKRQINYIYYPYNGYQSYYVNAIQRPTKQPHRRSTTTQRYSIWDLSRKRRSAESPSETGDTKVSQQEYSTDIREKRQIDDVDIDDDYYRNNFRKWFGRRQNYAQPRDQEYSMWDLTR